MTTELISRQLPKSEATAKCHFDQEAKKLQSTKIQVNPEKDDIEPTQEEGNIKTNDIMCSILARKILHPKVILTKRENSL